MRPLSELIDHEESAWPLVQEWISEASVPVEVLPAERAAGDAALYASQVTTRSPMGAIAHNSAGLLIDNGWLRVLGAGRHPRFHRSLPEWNEGRANGFHLVADDAVGGFFALNGGALGTDLGNVYFYAPDLLRWEPCGSGYSMLLVWAMSGKLEEFYRSLRWDGWVAEVKRLSGDQAINIYPFLSVEGEPIKERRRMPVPVAERWEFQGSLQRQLDRIGG
ncbi:DUF2625 family protein [Longimicrobium sp.]|uniref:DUF2625 family protein n=1 Tax=Longimicrobium sp. TaxID=2029185 RepID=UPI002E2FDD94|nr:DUF2625 family protein [Longimicrobium sp.]HEX6039367.1 DUF2625 family protein [Longimicrobium sp.]